MQAESTKNNMNAKQQATTATTTANGSKPKGSGKPSQFSNKVITKDDIMLLSRGKGSHHQSHIVNNSNDGVNDNYNNNVNNNVDNNSKNVILPPKSVIVDSIPANESNLSDAETVQSQDSDILFSPLYDSFQKDEFYEQEMYNDDYNTTSDDDGFSSSLRKFKNYQMIPASENISTSNDLALPFGIQDEIEDADFWKEIKGTNEDIIPFNNNVQDDIRSKRRLSMVSQHMANATMEDFVSDDLLATSSTTGNNNNTNSNTPMPTDMSQYKIKLLCYRDADGKLALKTTNQNKRNNYSLSGPTGLVKRKRVNKKKKMLKKAIRRKSGVLEMISTGVKMNEFML